MTDRPPHPDPLWPDPGLAAIERRLERRDPVVAPPALRHRVLMAVDDALAAPRPLDRDEDVRIPGWAWAAAAVLGVVLTVPVVAGMEALRPSAPRMIADRLRAAGVTDEPLVAALAAPPRPVVAADRERPAAPVAAPRPLSRALEIRRLLEETL
jgi:hypothetical protein